MERPRNAPEVHGAPRRRISHSSGAVLFCAVVLAGVSCSSLRAQQLLPGPYGRQTALMPDWGPGGAVAALTTAPAWRVAVPLESLAQADADLAAGIDREEEGQESCVDFFYRAAMGAWMTLECAAPHSIVNPQSAAAWQIYQESLARLIAAANRFGRLDPRAHLVVHGTHGRCAVRTAYYGFPWQPRDFCQVIPAAELQGRDLRRYYQSPGLGVSLVAVRRALREEPFFRTSQPFAVTAVLRPACCRRPSPAAKPEATTTWQSEATLDFYNPHLFGSISLGATVVPLARDLSAPFLYVARENPRLGFRAFLDPGETDVQPRLFMIEPYQCGKVPVVFIHGLLSDPTTWLDAVNDLQAEPDLYLRYQFWYFRYPTGGELLESAANLREQLVRARDTFDPKRQDRAMDRMVLVGHSMGGLIAQLQVKYSYDILWRHAARQPLEAVATTPAMRARLERDFFFDPSPSVSRVVFIGTPNRGASMARRMTGRFVSSLARPFGSEEPLYRELMDQNRDVFYEYLWRAPPTSIDLLEPHNPLLLAMAQMPYRRGVRLHSIIGTGGTGLVGEPSDGVVPVSSARHSGVCSELFVPARHTELHHDSKTVAELRRILREHAE